MKCSKGVSCRHFKNVLNFKLKKFIGKRAAAQVFGVGILPAIEYGAQITGFDDSELMAIKKIAGAVHGVAVV